MNRSASPNKDSWNEDHTTPRTQSWIKLTDLKYKLFLDWDLVLTTLHLIRAQYNVSVRANLGVLDFSLICANDDMNLVVGNTASFETRLVMYSYVRCSVLLVDPFGDFCTPDSFLHSCTWSNALVTYTALISGYRYSTQFFRGLPLLLVFETAWSLLR